MVLLLISVLLYWLGRQGEPRPADFGRMFIPPAAFLTWLLLQKPTVIDAVFSEVEDAIRWTVAVLLAVLIAALAAWLAKIADASAPTT